LKHLQYILYIGLLFWPPFLDFHILNILSYKVTIGFVHSGQSFRVASVLAMNHKSELHNLLCVPENAWMAFYCIYCSI